jgi:hypothetical protein
MIPTLLFVAFVVMMLLGVPIGGALGLAGAACIALANTDTQWPGQVPAAGDSDVRAGGLHL